MLQDLFSVTELVSASLRPDLLLEHHDSGFVQVDRQSSFLTVLFQQGQAVLETLGCGGQQNQVVRIQQAFDFRVVQSEAQDAAGAPQSFCQLVDVDVKQGWAQTASLPQSTNLLEAHSPEITNSDGTSTIFIHGLYNIKCFSTNANLICIVNHHAK